MFWQFPFFMFAGAVIYLYPIVGYTLGGAYLTLLILPKL